MRTEPFSLHDRSTIIAKLHECGKWQGVRNGCSVRLVRYQGPYGQKIQYAVCIGRIASPGGGMERSKRISDQAATVADAIEECNKLIKGRPPESRGNRRWSPRPLYSKFRQKFGGQP